MVEVFLWAPHRLCDIWSANHGQRGSASPVLTATGLVNGKWKFSTPYRIHTHQPITTKFVTGDHVGDPYTCAKFGAHSSMGGGFWANGWNIAKLHLFIYLYPFFGNSHIGQTRRWVFSVWWLKRRELAHTCTFWGFADIWLFIYEVKSPPKPPFWGWIACFQAKLAKY